MFRKKLGLAVSAALMGVSALPVVQAQQLEEIVVTAQRREQSLQEVPISIETFTGAEIRKQGYRDLEALAGMTPGLIAIPQQDQSTVMIRGFGTTGNALTLEQAAPIFMDGIHFGRMAQSKMAYLDVERIEVLKGPQPVFFGNNATAGAFSITSKKPTDAWEGDFDAEIGNNRTRQVNIAAGGPINDTWGIRVAGKYESTEGFLVDAIDQTKFPHQDDMGARVTLQWTPSETFRATTKFEISDIDAGSEAKLICLTGDNMVYGPSGPLVPGANGAGGTMGEPFSVWGDPPIGEGTSIPHLPIPRTGEDCFDSNVTRSNEGPYYDVPDYIRQTNIRQGMLDIREAAQAYMEWQEDPIRGPLGAFDSIMGGEDIGAINSYINLEWTLGNDIEVSWLNGFSKYNRETSEENFDSPYYENNQVRKENFDQWSSELRFTSPTGGRIEWMAGLYVQDNTLDVVSGNLRATVRDGLRMNNVWEDVRWKSVFSTLTFNFFDNKASVDFGGRYSDISKWTFAGGQVRQWIVNGAPVATPGTTGTLVQITNPAEHDIFLDYDPALGLYYYMPQMRTDFGRGSTIHAAAQVVPTNWRGTAGARVVGLTRYYTPAEGAANQGPMGGRNYPGSLGDGDFGSTEFDPQIVLRYRPNENHSLFARWAESFKLGGFDTGQTSIPADYDEFAFDNERSETFEIGSKGNLFDGQARYEVTVFESTFFDLQLQAATGRVDDPNANVNAGAQVVKGVEFNFDYAATDNLTLGLSGIVMDAVMDEFFNAPCNAAERRLDELGCDFDGTIGADGLRNGTINRSGQQAPYSPDWGFNLDVDYRYPVFNNYELSFNARGYISDGYFTSSSDFTHDVEYDTHGDLNLSLGIGPQDESWRILGWAHNIIEASQKYNPEIDFTDLGSIAVQISPRQFRTYGLKFEYSYR